jgi:MOSC domain-containing protein YiiM
VSARVIGVSRSSERGVAKQAARSILLVEGLGVEGDVHAGATVRHRSRMRRDPTQPNLRQVHLIHAELFRELAVAGFEVGPGDMGENVTTHGIDLLGLPVGAILSFGQGGASVRITGLRNPCAQLDGVRDGLMEATLERLADGTLIRKAGVMAVVERGGEVAVGDAVEVALPAGGAALAPV